MNVKSIAIQLLWLSMVATGLLACSKPAEDTATPKASKVDPSFTFLLSQAQFTRDANGKPSPGAAKLRIVTLENNSVTERILEDSESRVFHKALCRTGDKGTSLWTIGATGAHLKEWNLSDLTPVKTHYSGKFGGKWDRLRDFETIKSATGENLWAIATHDQGHVLTFNQSSGAASMLHDEKTTFVHEVEVGDLNGDGLEDFATTPSKPNKAGKSQPGRVDAYLQAPDGTFKRAAALSAANRHAKEIFITDWNLDGTAELYVVLEGRLGPQRELVEPVEIVRVEHRDGKWLETGRVEIPRAKQARVLLSANVDEDRNPELIVSTMRSGIWAIDSYGQPARQLVSGTLSSGFEHAVTALDTDGDEIDELFVTSEDQDHFSKWSYRDGRWSSQRLRELGKSEITWSIEHCNE